MRNFLLLNILLLVLMGFLLAADNADSDDKISCPEKCVESRKNCDLSCSQIVGGGAKSRERRICVNDCGTEQEKCNDRCLNPTPKPTLRPEPFSDKPCPNACEFKAKDCYVECAKYTGGGAKSEKKAVCRQECSEELSNCKGWCVNPTPKPTLRPKPIDSMSCPEVCKIKKLDCDANCSSFLGGGAKSEKRSECMNECENFNNECLSGCRDTE